MNKIIASTGAFIVTISVLLFAICMLIPFNFGSYFICMLLPIGYIMMTSGFCNESDEKHRVAANAGMTFATIYTVLIFLVYFAQTTSVRLDSLDEQAMKILDYSRGGLFFSYDLLGYGMMALSTFFVGLTIETKTKADKWLKYLMLVHGVFFFSCFIMPMTGRFSSMSDGGNNMGGVIALEFWCAYFIPIGILSLIHFRKSNKFQFFGEITLDRCSLVFVCSRFRQLAYPLGSICNTTRLSSSVGVGRLRTSAAWLGAKGTYPICSMLRRRYLAPLSLSRCSSFIRGKGKAWKG